VYGVTMQEPGVSSIVSVRLRNGPAVDEDTGRVTPDLPAAEPTPA